MPRDRILVVGAGPAGLSAAASLAKAGERVIVVDQAPGIGGAVYAQNRTDPAMAPAQAREFRSLLKAVSQHGNRIDIRCATSFIGLDYKGKAMIAGAGRLLFRPRALILATGAREIVRPRPGWTLPGVTTVGAIQVALKSSGRPPRGTVAIAGSGPLLYALGAQLALAGNAPRAIFDAAQPFRHPGAALRLPMPVIREAAGYVMTLIRQRVPILAGTQLLSIEAEDGKLRLTTNRTGDFHTLRVDCLGLHDGLACNDYGVPGDADIPVASAGDCRQVLGRFAAVKDGKRAAAEILGRLRPGELRPPPPSLAPEEAAQARLERMFAQAGGPLLHELPGDTIICRCENRSLADLNDLKPAERTVRTLRLNGRFGMGACQGRFCLDWVATLAAGRECAATVRGRRWPVRPVSIDDMLNATDESETEIHIHAENAT